MQSKNVKREKAFLVGLISKGFSKSEIDTQLHERKLLANTAGADTLSTITQKRDKPDSSTFIGKGKIMEVKTLLGVLSIDMVIFDDELSPSQLRNIEKIF